LVATPCALADGAQDGAAGPDGVLAALLAAGEVPAESTSAAAVATQRARALRGLADDDLRTIAPESREPVFCDNRDARTK